MRTDDDTRASRPAELHVQTHKGRLALTTMIDENVTCERINT